MSQQVNVMRSAAVIISGGEAWCGARKVMGSKARAGWEGCGSIRVAVGVGGERFWAACGELE